MSSSTPQASEIAAATMATKRQAELHVYGMATQEDLSDAKIKETKAVLKEIYPRMISEEAPVWASHLFDQLSQINGTITTMGNKITAVENKITAVENKITAVDSRLAEVATQVTDVRKTLERFEIRLIKTENRASVTNTDDRALQEVPNGAGLVPSSANLAPLVTFSILTSLSNEEIRRYLAFYGMSNSSSGEKNRQALRACLGVPLMPQQI